MAERITCFNLNCGHCDIATDTCMLDPGSVTIGSSGICCEIRSAEEQIEDQEAPLDTTEEIKE